MTLNRPTDDAFTARLMGDIESARRNPDPGVRSQTVEDFEAAFHAAIDAHRAEAAAPWKRLSFWLAVIVAVLGGLSIVQLVLALTH